MREAAWVAGSHAGEKADSVRPIHRRKSSLLLERLFILISVISLPDGRNIRGYRPLIDWTAHGAEVVRLARRASRALVRRVSLDFHGALCTDGAERDETSTGAASPG